jgi:hypothetical protein
MKATTLLEQQHRNLQQLCEVVERGSANIRRSLLPQLAGDLAAYLAVEEQVFYPAASAALHEPSWVSSAGSWHARALRALHRALDAAVDGEEFEQAIVELRTVIALHVVEDEQLLFPRLERALDAGAMRQLGLSMMALYEAKLEAGYVAPVRSA